MKKAIIIAAVSLAIMAGRFSPASAACTPFISAFPGAIDTFVANDCIPSAWANQLEATIGTTASTVTSSLQYVANGLASTTPLFNVNSNRSDNFAANGSTLFPFKSLSAAIASSTGYSAYSYNLFPGTYVDGAPDTFGNSPFVISGNESTYVPVSGVTFPGSFDIYDLTIVGNVVESDNTLNFIHQFNNGVITGNFTAAGLATLTGMTLPTTTSTVTVLGGANTNLVGGVVNAPITVLGGQLNLADEYSVASTTGYFVTASGTGGLISSIGGTYTNTSGNGFNLQNGATSSPNAVFNTNIIIGAAATSTVNAGSAATIFCNNAGLTTLTGTFVAPTGSNWKPCYDEDRSVLTSLSVGTNTLNNALNVVGTSTFTGGVTVNGNVSSTSFSSNSTSSSNIQNLNNTLYVPSNFATAGCAGSSTATTLQGCIAAMAAQQIAAGQPGMRVWVTNSVAQANWTNSINLNNNGFTVSLDCTPGVQLKYGGAANATSALIFNFGNPTGHTVSDDFGCTYMGQNSLIAAAQTNTATTTGVFFGGNQGAVGIDFHDNNVNGFGQQAVIGSNAYMLTFQNNSLSGGNGGGMLGSCLFVNPANNSGERNVLSGVNCVDPGNSTTTNFGVYISDGATASNFISNISLDDASIYLGFSNGFTNLDKIHIENSAYGTYGAYIPIYATSSVATMLSLTNVEVANDANNSGQSFNTIVKHGVNLYASAIHIDNYGGQTVSKFADHSLNNGSESEMVCDIQVQGGGLTSIVSNQAYSQAAGATCTQDVANSWPVSIFQNGNNTADIRNGNANVGTFDSTGNWVLGISGTSGSLKVQGNVNATGTISASSNISGVGLLSMTGTSSTLKLGTSANASHGCIEMYDAVNSSTIDYLYASSTALVVTATNPGFCN